MCGKKRSRRVTVKQKSVVCLSGLDSAVALGWLLSQGVECHPICFSYGQRHSKELDGVAAVYQYYKAKGSAIALPRVVSLKGLDYYLPLTSEELDVSADHAAFIPHRNLYLLALAASYATGIGADLLTVGFIQAEDDEPSHEDQGASFLIEMQAAIDASMGNTDLTLYAPFNAMTKTEVVLYGAQLGVPLWLTWSCYVGGEKPCEKCEACRWRIRGFRQAGLVDAPGFGRQS